MRSALGVMPTGTGKTIVFASIIRKLFPGRVMVVAHRQELIWQAREKIQRVTGLTVDVEMGQYKCRLDGDMLAPRAQVIVSTVQTQVAGGDGGGRIGKFDPKDFVALIVDEGHHATSGSYRRLIEYYMTNPKLVVLGVTATPDRADEQALGQVFEGVAFDYELLDAIHDGWLVPIEQQMVSIESLDFSSVRTQAGDLNGVDLDAVMKAEKNLHGVASSTIDIIGDKRGIGFASSVEHARMLSEIFNRHRSGMSNFVCAKTPEEERKLIITDFAAGRTQFLWNCGVFTEGFDDSGVEVVALARPTKSRSLYAQMIGRSTRPAESIAHRLNDLPDVPALRRTMIARSCKPSCLAIDFVGVSGKHKLITTADILSGNLSEEAVEAATAKARKSGGRVRMDKLVDEEEKRLEEAKARKLESEARRARITFSAKYKMQSVDPFDVLQVKPAAARGWDNGKQLSEKMRNVLRRAGYDPDQLEYARARQLVGILIDRWTNHKCTIKQAALLERCGWSKPEAADMSFESAKRALDAAAKNRWRKPVNYESPASSSPVATVIADAPEPFIDDVPF